MRAPAPVPRLRLLIEWEPRHRVFMHNLADMLLSRRPPQLRLTSRPARYWNDVFVPTGAPWSSFAESMLLHLLLVVLVVWGQSRVWTSVELFPQQRARHTPITYYPPKPSFRAAEGRAQNVRARVKRTQQAAHQTAMPVKPQQTHSIVTPPDIKQAAPPNLPGSYTVTPTVPFPATSKLRRNAMAAAPGVVAPPPQVDQAATRRMALPHASAVAPAPELGGSFAERATKAPNANGSRVVPPPPAVQIAGNSGRGVGSLSARTNVVPPPPSIQDANAVADARLGSLTGAGSQVVPPPPSVQGTSKSGRAGRLTSGTGPNVVPPPPSVQGASNGARDSRSGSIAGSQVVQPPPSVQGAGNISEHARLGALPGASSEVVKPPPTVDSASNSGGARIGSLTGNGSQIVPPPPAVESASNSGGRLGSLGGNRPGDVSQIAPPPSSVRGAGNSVASTAGKLLEPMDPLTDDAASPTSDANNDSKASFEELPLGLLGVVFVPPGTSYFSNFEVFVAKRRIGKELQLIKLVYEFLPYQRRLSEYNLNNLPQRVIKLRVIPDPSCDESLGQMIQTSGDSASQSTGRADLPAALRSSDLTAMLPCYRTTASDFEKAMSRGR